MTNNEMETAIKWIRLIKNTDGTLYRNDDNHIYNVLTSEGYSNVEIKYCYVMATGKNMEV